MAGSGPARPTDLELRILKILWQQAPLRVREIRQALFASGNSISQFKRRVLRVLGPRDAPPRRLPRRGVMMLALMLMSGVLSPLAVQTWADQPKTVPAAGPGLEQEVTELLGTIKDRDAWVRNAFAQAESKPRENGNRAARDETVTVSGTIVLEDGTPASAQGLLRYDVELPNGNGASGNAAQPTSDFSVKLPAGRIVLEYYLDGFAPSWTKPFQMNAGEKRDDIRFVLTPGQMAEVTVVDKNGAGVAGAKLVAHPEIHGQTDGPNYVKTTDENGKYTLKHLADSRYAFQVTAPGFQPLRTEAMEIDDEGVQLTLVRSLPTTGRVTNADGTPVAGAKLRAIHAEYEDGRGVSFSNEGGGYWGKVFATTDAEGRFELNQLAAGADYLFLIEAGDGARLVQYLRDDQQVDIAMPARRNLRIRIVGDTGRLRTRRGKPFVAIRQPINFEPNPGHRYGALVGQDVPVKVTPAGATAVLRGVVSDPNPGAAKQQIEIFVGNVHRRVQLSPDGDTEVTVKIGPESKADKTSPHRTGE